MSDQLMENNAGFEQGPVNAVCPNGQLYTVKSGDTMFFIAKRFNSSLQDLINANPQISDPNTIYPGQVICIPISSPKAPCLSGQIYRVVSGDTMYDIAIRYGITLDSLIVANPQIQDPNLIFPGQEICIPLPPVSVPVPMPLPAVPVPMPMPIIPGPVPMPCPAVPVPMPMPVMPAPVPMPMPLPAVPAPVPCLNGTLYTVRSGDTLFDIARANNILLASLIAANPQIADPNLIFPGQVICVPTTPIEVPVVPPPVQCPMPNLVSPIQQPMPMPVAPIEQPALMPAMPCPPGQGMMYPMPVYIVIPWDECPHRCKKRKHERRKHRCR